ncbi:MAG: hypothetical protein CME40_05400 [Haliea sp.]|nr:hypothetical protein [Haliea sp.]|tara:strand:+ start:98122 stop:98556 length:435 start_codon:yes stop_codon:yes gene_type:complete
MSGSNTEFLRRLTRAGLRTLDHTRALDFLAPLLLRFYLASVFIAVGLTKLMTFPDTVSWFGNPDWGLGLPVPWLMAALATWAELLGGLLLLFGLGTRLIAVLNNGIEFAATYFVMLLSLFFTGAGRFVSLDYWWRRWWLNDENT